jgi:hypothetical protein
MARVWMVFLLLARNDCIKRKCSHQYMHDLNFILRLPSQPLFLL